MHNNMIPPRPSPERKKINDITYIIDPKLVHDARSGKPVWAFPDKIEVDENGNLRCSEYVRRAGLKQTREGKIEQFSPEFKTMIDVPDADPGKLWLWKDRLLANDLCHLAGKPGTGKSLLLAEFAARVSRGGLWPHQPEGIVQKPGDVILCSSEDSESELKFRLEAAGADLSRIRLFRTLKSQKSDSDERIPANLAHVKELQDILDHTPSSADGTG